MQEHGAASRAEFPAVMLFLLIVNEILTFKRTLMLLSIRGDLINAEILLNR